MENIQNQQSAIQKFIASKFNAPGLKEKTRFFTLFALSQRAGLGLRDALIAIKKSENNKGMVLIIDDLIDQLTQGHTFSQAMEQHKGFFHDDEIALIQSSETMGNLPEICDEIAVEGENYEKINQKIKKAMTYPVILLTFALVAVVVMLMFVIPTIVSMFPNQESLPGITRLMLDLKDIIANTWYLIVGTVVGAITAYNLLYKYFLPFKMFIDKMMITLPVVSDAVKTTYMYKFTRLLGQLYGAGVSPVVSLQLMSNSFSNFYYKKKTLEIRDNLKTGFGFAESMEGSSLFDIILIQIIHIGEETGNMGDVLKKMSSFYRDNLSVKIETVMGLLEPIMMAFIAVIIGSMVAAIFLPMADLVNVIQ